MAGCAASIEAYGHRLKPLPGTYARSCDRLIPNGANALLASGPSSGIESVVIQPPARRFKRDRSRGRSGPRVFRVAGGRVVLAAVLAIYASGLQPFRLLPVYASHGPSGVAATAATAAVQRLTATSVNCTPTVIGPGEPTVCTATVSDIDLGTPTTPTGNVRFTSSGAGTFSSSSCTLFGSGNSASCSVSYTSTGLGGSAITATYGGDATHAGSSGSTLVADPPKRTTSTSVSCIPGSVVVGQSKTCTATG